MKFNRLCLAVAILGLGLAPVVATAHKESDSYLTLRTDPTNDHVLQGRWDIALRDLAFVLPIDANHNGGITWGEVKAHRGAIERYALSSLTIKGDGLTCATHPTGQKISHHTDGAYNVLFFKAVCDKVIPSKLTIVYGLFRDVDPYHRGIVTIHAKGETSGAVLGPHNAVTTLNIRDPNRWRQFKTFVMDGIWHIWTGMDHLLFIISLLLPAVLIRRRKDDGDNWPGGGLLAGGGGTMTMARARVHYYWAAVPTWWPAFIDVIKVISAFTLSHSVTVTLAVLGIVSVPSRLVESAIALSVIAAAANNLYPIVRQRVWLIAFAFGFVHGLGFASALSGLQLPPLSMAASLGGFNIGVELGQEAIVLGVMPIAFLLRYTRFYRVWVLRWGSLLIVLIASLWLFQRAFGIPVPGVGAILPG
ncbi:MAG: HupE/UreJ family protein [Gammaproteobacteria bacterium]|nr:HupE/UreJ family protein [Gammaproteobacteria bacterium]